MINTVCYADALPDLVHWSFDFLPGQLAQLGDGQAALTGQMDSAIQVYLGSLELELTVNTPPILTVRGPAPGRDDHVAGRPDAGDQLHDHQRRGERRVPADLSVEHDRDADRDGHGRCDVHGWSGACTGAGVLR